MLKDFEHGHILWKDCYLT